MSGCTDPTSISYSPLAMMMRNNCWSKSQIFPNNEVEFIYLCYLLLTEKTKKDTKLQLLWDLLVKSYVVAWGSRIFIYNDGLNENFTLNRSKGGI